jgi:hypothetical protein
MSTPAAQAQAIETEKSLFSAQADYSRHVHSRTKMTTLRAQHR